jgi:lysophospholipase L1-like esterase
MDPEVFKQIRQTVEENNQLLHELIRAKRWGNFIALAKWVVVIGAALGIYYYFQPMIDQTLELYKGILAGADTIFAPLKNLPR